MGHFTADKKDWDIQVLIPDMNTTDDHAGFNGPAAGQTLTMVFTKSAGIKNDSEAGTHSVGYDILGPTESPGKLDKASMSNLDNVKDSGSPLATLAKISLSDVDNKRGLRDDRHRLRLQQRHLRRRPRAARSVHRRRAQRRR